MSGWAISSAVLPAFTEPPYWMRTRGRSLGPELRRDHAADGRAHRLGVVGGRRPPGADRPDRLVGDDQRADLLRLQPGEPGRDLTEHLGLGLPRLALGERLAART